MDSGTLTLFQVLTTHIADGLMQQADAPVWLPDDYVAWIEREFYIPETMQPIQLVPYQRAVVREALRRDESGDFAYSLVLYSDLKKSAKSAISAAVALALAWHHEWETVRIVANDLKQAESRTFHYIRRAILLNPRLKAVCKVTGYKITLPNNTIIEAVPIDPGGEAGGGDLFLCWTELWAAKNKAARQMWSETSLSPLKFGKSLRWCESYAGFENESPLLETLYANAVLAGDPVSLDDADAPDDLELTRSGRTLALWNTKPRCPWQTDEFYAQAEREYTPNEFRRHHRNQWVTSVDVFVDPLWWDACRGEFPDFGRKPLVVSADAGVSDDCFAIVAGHLIDGVLYPRYCRIWHAPPGGKILYSNTLQPEDETTPEGYLRYLARTHHLVYVTYDEYQLHDFMTRIQMSLGVACEAFPQGKQRAISDKMLYDTIRDGRLVHDGNAGLSEHVKNANRKAEGEHLRIVKRAQEKKIDAAVCLSMINYVCREVLIL